MGDGGDSLPYRVIQQPKSLPSCDSSCLQSLESFPPSLSVGERPMSGKLMVGMSEMSILILFASYQSDQNVHKEAWEMTLHMFSGSGDLRQQAAGMLRQCDLFRKNLRLGHWDE